MFQKQQEEELLLKFNGYSKLGLIGTVDKRGDFDGGDAPRHTATALIGMLLEDFDDYSNGRPLNTYTVLCLYRQLEIKPGVYIRYPGQSRNAGQPGVSDFAYWNKPENFSRDQWSSIVIVYGFFNLKVPLRRMFMNHVKRMGKYQNKDWAGPVQWGEYVRSFRLWYLYPALCITDLFILGSTLIHIYKRFQSEEAFKENAKNHINHWKILLQSKFMLPTPVSCLAKWLYKFTRPKDALEWEYRHDYGAGYNPPMIELWTPIIEREFS